MILSIFRRPPAPARQKRARLAPSGRPLLIVGLGNPGKEYEGTRHNAGRDAVSLFAKRAGLIFEAKRELFSDVASGVHDGKRVILARPTVFMNQSGKAVAALQNFFRIKTQDTIMAQDDMDLPLGTIKIVFGRGSGGHKGVESVFRALKTRDIVRVRIGSMGQRGQKPGNRELANVVLKRLTPAEKTAFAKGVRSAADALETIVAEGYEKAMNRFN